MATHSAFSSFWAGVSALLLAGAIAPAALAEPAASDVAEVRIGLPAGASSSVSVSFAEGGVQIEMPRGSSVPMDLESAAGGLLRRGELTSVSADRVRLSLLLASGLVDQVRYEPDAVTLRFARRRPIAADPQGATTAYRLGVDDKVQISVDGQPEYTRSLGIGPNGTIAAPLLGEIPAAGLTVDQLASAITDRLARDFLVDPRVSVEVVEYKSQWIMMTGAVRTPGRVPLRGGTDLKEAISGAGGLAVEAGDEIVISRRVLGKDDPTLLRISRPAFESGESNPLLENGDVVNVSKVEYCYVQGEVRNNVRVPLEKGLTLLRAVTLAGGFTEWANKKNVQVLSQDAAAPSRFVNVKDIEALKIPDPELRAGDVIIVKRRSL